MNNSKMVASLPEKTYCTLVKKTKLKKKWFFKFFCTSSFSYRQDKMQTPEKQQMQKVLFLNSKGIKVKNTLNINQ